MSDKFDDWVTVVAPAGGLKQTIRDLLALAGDPTDVRTQGNGDELLVPPDLAAAYDAVSAPAPVAKKSATRKPRAAKEGS